LKDKVREVLLIGAAADRIAQELSGAVELVHVGDLESAVQEAFQRARPGDVVLLSPACSSYDQFQDYEHRGRVFKELVERLAQEVDSGSAERKRKAEPLAASSHEVSEGSGEPPAEALAPELETPSLAPASHAPPQGEVKNEMTLVYEISADELPPAEVELAEDYSEQPEPSEPQALFPLETMDDIPLPFEVRAEEKGPAASGSGDCDVAEGGTEVMSGSSEGSPATAGSRKSKTAAPDWAPQPRLPGVDQ